MTVRLPGAGASMPGAAVNLTNGASMSNRSGGSTVANIAIGALTGDATSSLTAFVGGGTLPGTNWIIGARNETTTFAGTINDQTGGAISSVTKVGTGTLSLTGANLYTGNTTVEAGTLGMTNPFLADLADVLLTSGATMDLNFVGTDLIDELRFNGVGQVTGTWGSLASTATHKSAFFTGTGLLQVSTYVAPPSLVGDYNGNGVVDAADYTVWRDSLGSGTALANRDPLNTGNVSQADFISWRNNFGATLGSGAGSLATSAVPEPATIALVAMCVAFAASGARRRSCFGFRS
jgi:autotransporter-associated beta strand protein